MFHILIWRVGALCRGANPTKAPRGDGTEFMTYRELSFAQG